MDEDIKRLYVYFEANLHRMSRWERDFVTNMSYWLKVRKVPPTDAQVMLMRVLYRRLMEEEGQRSEGL